MDRPVGQGRETGRALYAFVVPAGAQQESLKPRVELLMKRVNRGRALFGLGTFFEWLRKKWSAPPVEPPKEDPTGKSPRGQGPYRHVHATSSAPVLSLLRRLTRFDGYTIVAILESDGERYERYLLEAPGPAKLRCTLSCFSTDDEDGGWADLRFDEARIVTRLHHPRLGRVLDVGGEHSLYWYLAEYPRGETLHSILARIRHGAEPPSLDVSIAAFADFAEGLHGAHTDTNKDGVKMGWTYQCMNPRSLLFTLEGTCQIVEWGLEKLIHGRWDLKVKATSEDFKTVLQYMAPEQISGSVNDGRADVFTLGVMLYQLTTGSPPFFADTELEILEQVQSQAAPPPSARVPGYPPELSALVLSALVKDPAERITAGALGAGLRSLLAARGVDDPAARVAAYVQRDRTQESPE